MSKGCAYSQKSNSKGRLTRLETYYVPQSLFSSTYVPSCFRMYEF